MMVLSPLSAVLVSMVLTLPCTLSDDGFYGVIYQLTIEPLLFLGAGAVWLAQAAKASGPRRLCHTVAFLLLFPVPVAAITAPATALIVTHDTEDLVTWHFKGERYRKPDFMIMKPGLPHADWRTWGFLSVWTGAYLVFDEADELASFAFQGGDVPGVPCGVWHVLPLEKHWYVVTLYSGQTWDVCG